MSSPSFAGRLFQIIFFEAVALALAVPLYGLAFDVPARAALAVLLPVAAVAFLWSGLHRVLFDWFDWHLTRRPETMRPAGTWIVRSLSGAATSLMLTFPMLIWLGALPPREAMLTALALAGLHWALGLPAQLVRERRRAAGPRTLMC
ncbi:chlorhexidine efflux transporter [Cereibacter sediminicola]|uniref:chlorhexidine efflux transporter n=1 Tax=Cereibacter sediminicola TaxID=2584941 RepID=UPI00119DD10B|nr:chlorhexidine efflux transporter [Cereibacter sediminicola]